MFRYLSTIIFTVFYEEGVNFHSVLKVLYFHALILNLIY